jgi:hypothetical protein
MDNTTVNIWGTTPGMTWQQVSKKLWANSNGNPALFTAYVYGWVSLHIKYGNEPIPEHIVQSPDETIQKGYGICGDMAVLMAAMLNYYNIPAQVVWGYIPSKDMWHDTVQFTLNGITTTIDHNHYPDFQRHGIGLGPGQYITS